MKILALELSTARGSLAWLERPARAPAAAREGACAPRTKEFVREWPNDRKNSSAFFENIEIVTKKFGVAETIVVGLGPGSYAGTRIAISAAIGLQLSSRARLIGYPSICAIESGEYCVIGDARRKSFFFAHIWEHEIVEGPTLFTETEVQNKIDQLNPRSLLFASELLPQFERTMIRYPSALVLARLAEEPQRSFSLPPLEPIYLREPHITIPRGTQA